MRQLNSTLALLLISLFTTILFGQNGIMVQVPNPEILPVAGEGKLRSNSVEFQALIDAYTITQVEQTFPSSRKATLQNVYSFYCDCNEVDLLADLAKHHELFVNPELIPEIISLSEPNDYNVVFATDYALDLIQAKGAWAVTTGNPAVEIAITDSNYDLNHQELIGKYTFVQAGLNNPNVDHGTAVAITAAGNTNNEVGKSSIGYNSNLRLYGMSYNSLLQASYDGAKVINASWAGGCSYIEYYQLLIDEIKENGSIVVAAAGNGGTCGGSWQLVYPASYRGVISVSSVGPIDNHERIPGDPTSTHQQNQHVDLTAPGYDVPLAIKNNQYITGNGTSFASPFVAGTVGLMFAVNPNLNHCEVEYLLKSNATNIDSLNPSYAGKIGAGRLNAKKTLEKTVDFTPLQIEHSIQYSYLNPVGDVVIEVGSDLPYSSADYNYVGIIQLDNGQYYQEYKVDIVYETGCTVTRAYFISEDDFYSDTMLILPVDLIEFTVNYSNNVVVVTWDTENESGIQSYEVYSSTDGLNWKLIGSETAYNRESTNSYQLVDTDFEYTTMYYQLRRTDMNGSTTNIGIQSLSLNDKQSNYVKIYPNPAVNYLTIQSGKKIAQVDFYTAGGQKTNSFIDLGNHFTVQTGDFTPGVYYTHILFVDGELSTEKIIVKP
jgi:subtilisin family serine protease